MGISDKIKGLQKAQIIIHNGSSEIKIPCTFNPSSYTITDTVRYAQKDAVGTDSVEPAFVGTTSSQLTLKLYFDSIYTGEIGDALNTVKLDVPSEMGSNVESVTKITNKLVKSICVAAELHAPPSVTFLWGDLEFKGRVESLTQNYTMFTPSGKPTRAVVDLTLRSGEKIEEKKKALESPDRTKCKVITEGMNLWSIAYEEYGDCEQWRLIAKANHLMNPFDIKQGQMIKIPAL